MDGGSTGYFVAAVGYGRRSVSMLAGMAGMAAAAIGIAVLPDMVQAIAALTLSTSANHHLPKFRGAALAAP